jgi:hypothetical protein
MVAPDREVRRIDDAVVSAVRPQSSTGLAKRILPNRIVICVDNAVVVVVTGEPMRDVWLRLRRTCRVQRPHHGLVSLRNLPKLVGSIENM